MMRTVIGVLLLAAAGCATPFTLSEQRAVMIARQVCDYNEDWAETATYNARRDGKVWSVLVNRVTGEDEYGNAKFEPGDTRTVLVDMSGKVVDYRRPPADKVVADDEVVMTLEDSESRAAESTNDTGTAENVEGAKHEADPEYVEDAQDAGGAEDVKDEE